MIGISLANVNENSSHLHLKEILPMTQFENLIEPDRLHWQKLKDHLIQLDLSQNKDFVSSLENLMLGSNYAISQLNRYPALINKLIDLQNFDLESGNLIKALDNQTDIDQIKQQLRLFRHQKLVEIIYLDICQNASVEITLLHLSELADLLIKQTLIKVEQILSLRHGQPVDSSGQNMTLNILGMGKLGGHELNFSSDIDLICCYSEEGQLSGFGKLTYSQYFTHVVKLFKQCLHEITADGFVYRVDLRLRPWGDAGPLAISHNAIEHYYQLHGREWEQYAMVKARVITGNQTDKDYLQSILKPFVFRRYHDYRVFAGLARLKLKIDQQSRQKKVRCNIKVGQGGIREIEFFVQAFQILKGGRNHQLQTTSLFEAIKILTEQLVVESETLQQMQESYIFLRLLENRIQMFDDQQTHELPEKQNTQNRLALLLNYKDWSTLESELFFHQQRVNNIFSNLFNQQNESQNIAVIENLDEMDQQQHLQAIQNYGFKDPQKINTQLQEFYQSKSLLYMSDQAKRRFHVFFPELLKLITNHQQQSEILEKLLELFKSIAGRSVYFELLYQNIPLLEKLINQFKSSNWIASEVTAHPMLLEVLLYPGELSSRFNKTRLQQQLQIQLQNVSDDEELELDVFRQFKRSQTIIIATAEIAEEISTEEVSLYLSQLAEILLQAVYELSLKKLTAIYGEPQCLIDDQVFKPDLCIIGYGKLGGNELHYQSDLDIIFLHNSNGEKQTTSGAKPVDNAVFFSRLAQKIISKISLLTAAGKLYEIDTRLRPDGASGMLVSPLQSYRYYQLKKAWVWEHQAIIRARYIAGNPLIKEQFEHIRRKTITLSRETEILKKEIIEMREKIYLVKKPPEGKIINIKHSRGCMVDIEFLVQYWVLKHANKFASLIESTDNIALISKLHQLGLISDLDLQLRNIYPAYHKCLHARVLQNQSADIDSNLVREEINLVKKCWNNTFK